MSIALQWWHIPLAFALLAGVLWHQWPDLPPGDRQELDFSPGGPSGMKLLSLAVLLAVALGSLIGMYAQP